MCLIWASGRRYANALEGLGHVRHGPRFAHRDHHGEPGTRLGGEDVDPHRGVPDVVCQRVADQFPDTVTVEPGSEQGSRGPVQSGQMQIHASHLAIADLHRGEVAVAADEGRPQRLDRRGLAVDLDTEDGWTTHPLTITVGFAPRRSGCGWALEHLRLRPP